MSLFRMLFIPLYALPSIKYLLCMLYILFDGRRIAVDRATSCQAAPDLEPSNSITSAKRNLNSEWTRTCLNEGCDCLIICKVLLVTWNLVNKVLKVRLPQFWCFCVHFQRDARCHSPTYVELSFPFTFSFVLFIKKKSELGERPLSKWHQRDRNIDRRHRAANYRKQKGDAGGLTSSNKLNTEMAGDSRSTQTRAVRANLEGSVLDGHPERVGK